MSKYILDWDKSYNKGVLKSANLEIVRQHFSIEDPGARMRQRWRNSVTAGRKYAITATGRFDIGIGLEIIKFIKENDVTAKLVVTDVFKNALLCKYPFHGEGIVSPVLSLRDYQEDTVQQCLKIGRGVCLVATAGGKTLISSSLINTILANDPSTRVLFITIPPLVKQTHDEFIKHGIPANMVSQWDGKHPLRDTAIVVASTVSITRTPPDKKWMDKIGLLMVDECLRGDQRVATAEGLKPIEDVNIGDIVLSLNTETNEQEYKPVSNKFTNLPKSSSYDHFISIELVDGSTLVVTPNHNVYTTQGVKRADELTLDDDIITTESC